MGLFGFGRKRNGKPFENEPVPAKIGSTLKGKIRGLQEDIAAGRKLDKLQGPGRTPISDEPVFLNLDSPIDRFLHAGEWYDAFTSSNVTAMQYNKEAEELTVEFHGGRGEKAFYLYSQVSISEAHDFATSPSKGKWVWQNLRLPGSVFGFRKPYVFLSGPSSASRKWMQSELTRKRHGDIPASGEKIPGSHPADADWQG